MHRQKAGRVTAKAAAGSNKMKRGRGRAGRAVESLESRRLLSAALRSVFDFTSPVGTFPPGGLTADARGDLFGVGGSGTQIFEVPAGANAPTTLVTLPAGTTITSAVTLDAAGNIYAGATSGGWMGDNYLFELPAGATSITRLATLHQQTGVDVQGRMAFDAAGNLYAAAGMFGPNSSNWAGTLIELPKGTSAVQVLAVFDAGAAGSDPVGVTIDAQGNLFGVCDGGGLPDANGDPAATDAGAVWELPAGSHTLVARGTFNDDNGYVPQGQLVIDRQGNLFGTAIMGGPTDHTGYADFGDVWEIPAGTNTLSVLVGFDGTNGCYPRGGLIMDAAGNLFGTTSEDSGGNLYVNPGVPTNGNGTVFEISAGTGTLTTLATFDASTGQRPEGELALDANGNLFGLTTQGGTAHAGNLFEVTGSGAAPINPSPTPQPTPALTTTVARSSVPQSAIAGQALHAQVGVAVSNGGATSEHGAFTVTLYASLTGVLDNSAVMLGSVTRTLALAAGQSATITVPLPSLPSDLPTGDYTLIARASNAAGATGAVATGPTVSVAAPHVALAGVVTTSGLASPLVGGQKVKGSAQVTLTNAGNVAATGPVQIALYAVTDVNAAPSGVPLAVVQHNVNLRPGASATVRLPLTQIPADLAGDYFILAQITDPNGAVTTVAAANAVTVQPPTIALSETLAVPNFPASLFAGQRTRASAWLTIINTGNVPASTATVSLFASPTDSAAGAGDVVLATLTVRLNLRPGASRTIRVPLRSLPADLAAGSYVLLAQTTDATGNTTTALADANSFEVT
jgi:hypothetical protein